MVLNNKSLSSLINHFSDEAIIKLDTLLLDSDSFSIEPWVLAEKIGIDDNKVGILELELEKLGIFKRKFIRRCLNCQHVLSDEDVSSFKCSHCNVEFPRDHDPYEIVILLTRHIDRSYDLGWVITIHGMNTRGQWQQDLQWLIGLTYKRTIPFANWKYGKVWFTPIVVPLQKMMVTRFIKRYQRYKSDVEKLLSSDEPPDIIAHSFGTWLIGHALKRDQNLKVGYIILTGSILRPDFDWKLLVARGQVKQILNHYGGKDWWAKIAAYCIPDSGPSGRIGFTQSESNFLYNVLEPDYKHSDFFSSPNLTGNMGSAWKLFFRGKIEEMSEIKNRFVKCDKWEQPFWLLRAPVLPISFIIFFIIIALLIF